MADAAAVAAQKAALVSRLNYQDEALANTRADLLAVQTETANASSEAVQARADAAAAASAAAAAIPVGGTAGTAAPSIANVLKDLKVKLDKFLGHTDLK
eukprot:1225191-Rhodomonas_salina.1